MIEKIKELCEKNYPKRHYDYHIVSVVDNALLLAKRLNADVEIVEVAAYLHDIAWAFEKCRRDNEHHVVGAKKTEEILREFGYDEEFIKKVTHCVLTHRGRNDLAPKTIEAKIIANADAMAHFDTFLDLFSFFMEGNSFEDAVSELIDKMDRNWNKKLTLPEAKEMVEEKYKASVLLLNEMQKYIDKRHK
jgi:uncharacterized protein